MATQNTINTTTPTAATYFAANPDVAAAYQANTYGLTPDQFAQTHYQTYGVNEKRAAPTPTPVTPAPVTPAPVTPAPVTPAPVTPAPVTIPTDWSTYNPQQKVDYFNQQGIGVDTLQTYGVPQSDIDYMYTLGYTGNKPASVTTAPSAATLAYFAANPDVADAYKANTYGLTPDQFAQQHYFQHGAAEERIAPAYMPSEGYLYATKPGGIGEEQYYGKIRQAANDLSSTAGEGAAFSPQLLQAAKQYGVSLEDIKNSLTPEFYTQFTTDLTNTISSGIASVLSDGNVSLGEAADTLKTLKDYGLTTDQAAQFAGDKAGFITALQPAVDAGLTSVVSGWVSDKDITTEEAKNLLGLAQKYGLTDADLAKYTGGAYTEQQVGEYFAPVREFRATVQSLLDDRNATPDAIRSKIAELSASPLVAEIYAPQLQALTSALDTAGDKWSTGAARLSAKSGQNVLAAEKLYQQLAAMRNTVKENLTGGKEFWSGEGYGSLDENMQGFTQHLLEKGITDLRQLDVQTAPVIATGAFERAGDQWVQLVSYRGPGDTGEVTDRVPVTDPALLEKLNAQYVPEAPPITRWDREHYTPKTYHVEYDTGKKTQTLVNKETGQVVVDGSMHGGDDIRGDNTFRVGYTTKGEGMVNWNLKMVPQTNPETGETSYVAVPVQQYESTSDIGNIAPLLAVAQFVPGVAPFAMAANAAIAASQGNWLGAITSGLGAVPGLSAAAGAPLAAGTTQTLGNVASGLRVANAVSNGDYLGALTATGNLVGAGGWTVPGTEGVVGADGLQLGELSKGIAALGALAQGQVLPGLLAGADLAGVKDIMGTGIAPRDVASAANVIQAVQSDNPTAIINTLGRTAQNYGKLPKMAAGGLASLVG